MAIYDAVVFSLLVKNFTKSIAIGFNEYWFVGLQGK
jgi:hypothetical protein